jgi:hypothetical protein
MRALPLPEARTPGSLSRPLPRYGGEGWGEGAPDF